MIDRRDTNVVMIPIDQINVVNPRSRGAHKFKQIVTNIANIGLKKPITVVQRATRDGRPQYDLVCGQGRLEACRQLGETTVAALVIDASREELLLMSLAENLARKRQRGLELLREISALKDRGYSHAEIAQKTDVHLPYVKGVLRLLKQGEHRLLQAVERGQVPVSIAVTIATSDDAEVQRALAEAYESNSLRGKQLLRARRLIEERRNIGKAGRRRPGRASAEGVTQDSLLQAYRRETTKQRVLVHKAKVCETRLLVISSALKQLFADEGLLAILRATALDKPPQFLLEEHAGKETPR